MMLSLKEGQPQHVTIMLLSITLLIQLKRQKHTISCPPCREVTAVSDASALLKNTSAGQMLADRDRTGAIGWNERLTNYMQPVCVGPIGLECVFKV